MKQLPQIQKLHEEYGEKGLAVVGLTVERDNGKLKEFASQSKLSYTILLNSKGAFKDYRLGQIPDVCIINRDLVISSMYMGFNSCNEGKIETEIGELLETSQRKPDQG